MALTPSFISLHFLVGSQTKPIDGVAANEISQYRHLLAIA